VPARVSPTQRIRAEIDELFTADRDLGEILEDVARLGARLLLQAALEAEVTEFLGRDRYARGERTRVGYRNGHAELTVKSTAGPVTWSGPSCAESATGSSRGCSARAWPAPMRWSRWSSPGSSAA
jgi:putative transposase